MAHVQEADHNSKPVEQRRLQLWTIDSLQEHVIVVSNGTIAEPPPLRRTVEVSTIPHDWHNRVRNDPSRPSKVDGSRVI